MNIYESAPNNPNLEISDTSKKQTKSEEEKITKLFKQYSNEENIGPQQKKEFRSLLKDLSKRMDDYREGHLEFDEKQIKSILKSAEKNLKNIGGKESTSKEIYYLKNIKNDAIIKLAKMHNIVLGGSYENLTMGVDDNCTLADAKFIIKTLDKYEKKFCIEYSRHSFDADFIKDYGQRIETLSYEYVDEKEFPIEKLADNCPNLKEINLNKFNLFEKPINLSLFNNIKSMRFNNCNLDTLDLPRNLTKISIWSSEVKNLSDLPESLETLSLNDLKNSENFSTFPKNLKDLSICDCRFKDLPDLPESVNSININNYRGALSPRINLKMLAFYLNRGMTDKIDNYLDYELTKTENINLLCEKVNVDALLQEFKIIKKIFKANEIPKEALTPIILKIAKERPNQFIKLLEWIDLDSLPAEVIENSPILQLLRNSDANNEKSQEIVAKLDVDMLIENFGIIKNHFSKELLTLFISKILDERPELFTKLLRQGHLYSIKLETGKLLYEKLNVDLLSEIFDTIKSYFFQETLTPIILKILDERPDQFVNLFLNNSYYIDLNSMDYDKFKEIIAKVNVDILNEHFDTISDYFPKEVLSPIALKICEERPDQFIKVLKYMDLESIGYQKFKEIVAKVDVDVLVEHFAIIKDSYSKENALPIALIILDIYPNQLINLLQWIDLDLIPNELINNFPTLQLLRDSAVNDEKFKEVPAQADIVVGSHPDISINELENLFEGINFLNEGQPGYCDPKYLSDDGTPISVEGVKEGLNKLINLISERRGYVGVPINEEDRIAWYEKIESFIKEIIVRLKPIFDTKAQTDDLELLSASKHVIALATAGLHCGGAWNRAALDINKTLQGKWEANVEQGINAHFTKWLQSYKIGIAEKLTQDFTPQVGAAMQPHTFNYLGKILMAEKGFVFPADSFDLGDSLIPDLDYDEVLAAIEKMLTPQALTAFFKSEIDSLLRSESVGGNDMEDRQAGNMMELMRDSVEPYCSDAIEQAKIKFNEKAANYNREMYANYWQDTKIALLDEYLETHGLAKVDEDTYDVNVSSLGVLYALKHLEYLNNKG